MIILDTNVVFELTSPAPAPAVVAWAPAQAPETIFTTVVSEAEMLDGIASMPDGRKRAALARAVERCWTPCSPAACWPSIGRRR